MANKVKFGLKNVHYAKITYGAGGSITYATPVAFPGAVNLSLDPQGDTTDFYADDGLYYTGAANVGYKGTFEAALVPDGFKTTILGDVVDSNGLLIEQTDKPTEHFALLFEIDGDVKARRVVLYDCTATRSAVASQTKTNSTSPITETMTITVVPTKDGYVKGQTTDTTSTSDYNNWYNAVKEPSVAVTT